MIPRFKNRFRSQEQGGPAGAGMPGGRESGTPGGARSRSRFSCRLGAVAVFLCLAAYVFVPSDTPAQDPMNNAGLGFVRGLKGEYFEYFYRTKGTVAAQTGRGNNTPWGSQTCTDNTPACCPGLLNTGAVFETDSREALVSLWRAGNRLEVSKFIKMGMDSDPISDVKIWVRYMTRLQDGNDTIGICPSDASYTEAQAGTGDTYRMYATFRGYTMYLVGAAASGVGTHYYYYQWATINLCAALPASPDANSCAVKPLSWPEIAAGLKLVAESYAWATDPGYKWLAVDSMFIDVISLPKLMGSRIDPVVDFGDGANFTLNWRANGGPDYILSPRPDELTNAASGTCTAGTDAVASAGYVVGTGPCYAVDANNVTTYFWSVDRAVGAGPVDYWMRTWTSQQNVNQVRINWNSRVGAPNRTTNMYLMYCALNTGAVGCGSADCACPATTDTTEALLQAKGWYTLKIIPPLTTRVVEYAYTFPTVNTNGIMVVVPGTCSTADCEFGFFDFIINPEAYDYFEARWIGEVYFATSGTKNICVYHNDGVKLWIDDNLVSPAGNGWWVDTLPRTDFTPVTLTAGWHKVQMEYYDFETGAVARLGECVGGGCTVGVNDGSTCVKISADNLRASWEAPVSFGFLNGWFGHYWDDASPRTVGDGAWKGIEHNQEIDFEWQQGTPCPLKVTLSDADWNARYTGFIRAEYAGDYSICLTLQGGGNINIDSNTKTWKEIGFYAASRERRCITKTLTQGEHFTTLEYYDPATNTAAVLKLQWTPVAPEYVSTSALDLSVVNDVYLGADGNTRLLYHFNDGPANPANDSAGVNNVGTIVGGIWKTDDLMGTLWDGTKIYPNYAKLYFDGAGGDGIFVSTAGASELDISDQITIEAWIKFAGCAPGMDYWPGIAHIEGIRNYGFYIHCSPSGATQLHYSYLPLGGTTLCGTLTGDLALSDGKWHHVAVAADPGDYERYYYDSAMVQYYDIDTAFAPKICGVTETVQTGDNSLGIGDYSFAGGIDEVRITAADLSNNGAISPTPGQGFVPPATNHYAYRYFDPSKTFTFSNVVNECLEFEVYLMGTNPAFGGSFDANMSVTGVLRSTGWDDQNGLDVYPGTDLSGRAKGNWYHRCIAIPAANTETMSNPIIAFEDERSGVYDILLDKIRITNKTALQCATCDTGVGSGLLYTFYDTGAPVSVSNHAETIPPVIYAGVTNYPQGVNVIPSHYLYANGLRRYLYLSEYEAAVGRTPAYFSRQICSYVDATVNSTWAAEPDLWIPGCEAAKGTRADNWAMRWMGAVKADTEGSYVFQLTCTNGGGRIVIDNATVTGACNVSLTVNPLTAGWHFITVDYWHTTGSASANIQWNPGAGLVTIPAEKLALRQLIPGAVEDHGGVGVGRESGTNPFILMSDMMVLLSKSIAGLGCSCSTVFDGGGEADAQALNALRGLRDYFLASSRIGEIYTRLYYRISSPISRVLETYPFLKQAGRTLLNPFVQLGKLLKGQGGQGSKAEAGMPAERPYK